MPGDLPKKLPRRKPAILLDFGFPEGLNCEAGVGKRNHPFQLCAETGNQPRVVFAEERCV